MIKALISVIADSVRSFSRDGCLNMSAATAFYAMLSTIPLIFVFVSGVGFFYEESERVIPAITSALDTMMPHLGETFRREIAAVERRRGLIGGVGLIFMLWSATLVFESLEFSFNRIFDVEKKRPFWRSKLVSLGLVVAGVVALAASVLLTAAAKVATSRLVAVNDSKTAQFFYSSVFIQYILPVMVLTVIFGVMYFVLSRRSISLGEAFAGGGVCALLFEGAKYLFAWYVARLGQHSIVYGSLGAIVVVILWFFYAAIIILFCGELIASYKRVRENIKENHGV